MLAKEIGIRAARMAFRMAGYGHKLPIRFPEDFDAPTREIITKVKPYTMTSLQRLQANIDSIRYVTKAGIEGAVVECGVWKGGSIGAMWLELQRLGEKREVFLYDTFEGMSAPTEKDRKFSGLDAQGKFDETKLSADSADWCYAGHGEVLANLRAMGVDPTGVHTIQGKVEDTLPTQSPDMPIAVLRLDTDWYESTMAEMEYLYPKLVPGGVLIFDDYNTWEGSREAADEYFAKHNIKPFLHRIDHSAVIMTKPR